MFIYISVLHRELVDVRQQGVILEGTNKAGKRPAYRQLGEVSKVGGMTARCCE